MCSNQRSDQQSNKNIDQQYSAEKYFEVEINKNNDREYVEIINYIGKEKNVRIPPYIQERPVIVIGEKAFMEKGLTSVIIPDIVTDIGQKAFAHNKLTKVIIPNSVTDIDPLAFAENRLIDITISNNVHHITIGAFYNNKLTSLTIPDSVTVIAQSAFEQNNLTNLTIPDTVTIIWQRAFAHNRLTNVTISKGLSLIRGEVFLNNQLTSITIPDGIKHITESAFAHNKLTNLTIPDSVISIRKSAFLNNKLSNITISAMVSLADFAFDNNGFKDFYIKNGSKAGNYILNDNEWSSMFFEETRVEAEINGIYEIVNAYSIIINHRGMNENETEKLGTKIKIYENVVLFGNEEYQLYDAEFEYYGKYSIMDYDEFLSMFNGLNDDGFDRKIIGNDFSDKVKVKIMKNDKDDYRMFFAGNKLIINLRMKDGLETEFNHLITSSHDQFFYIAKKITD
jgi:hypothetical protein